jgi:hypothetical protein
MIKKAQREKTVKTIANCNPLNNFPNLTVPEMEHVDLLMSLPGIINLPAYLNFRYENSHNHPR